MLNFYFYVYASILLWIVLAKPPNTNKNLTTANPISKLLDKFHQNDYKLAFERTEVARYDASLVKVKLRTYKYNRTTPVVNASFILTSDFGYDLEIIGQAFKFASNEYRVFPIRCEVNLCQAIATRAMGFGRFSRCGNIACPIVKNKLYYFCNWSPDELRFPPFIPSGQYMLELQYLYHSKEVYVSHSYGTVYRPIT